MRKLLSVILVLLIVAFVLAYPISVVDDAGRIVTIQSKPERIISAAPSATKFVQYLGLYDKIVGVTNWDDFEAERIGDLVPLNVEKILSLKPDIVLIFGGFQLPEVTKLEEQNITAVVLNANTVQQILNDLILVGNVLGEVEKARKLSKELENKYLSLAKKAYGIPVEKRVKVAYLMDTPGPEIREIWTCGQGSYLNDLITLAGGINIAAGFTGPNGFLPISIEYIVSQDPDVFIVANYVPGAEDQVKEKIMSYSPFKSVKAVKNERIYVYDGNLLSMPVPQLVEFIEQIYIDFYGGS